MRYRISRRCKSGTHALQELQQGYKSFLDEQKTHPRRGEARVKLADLYIQQGQSRIEAVNKTPDAAEKRNFNKPQGPLSKTQRNGLKRRQRACRRVKQDSRRKIDPSDSKLLTARFVEGRVSQVTNHGRYGRANWSLKPSPPIQKNKSIGSRKLNRNLTK